MGKGYAEGPAAEERFADLERAERGGDEEAAPERAAVYGSLQRDHQKVSPFVIMFQQIEVSAQRKNVDNWVIGPSSDTNFYAPITKN